MIIIKLTGGLGNQMFQYAIGLVCAETNPGRVKLDISGYEHKAKHTPDTLRQFDLGAFKISIPIATKEEVVSVKYPFGIISKGYRFIIKKVFRKHYTDYHPEIFKNLSENTYIDGFFQSEKNFLSVVPKIIKEFTLKEQFIDQKTSQFTLSMNQTNSISVHIRRGDVANNPKTNKYHGLCPISYYEQAIEFVLQRVADPHFYIFSDDIEWVRSNLKIPLAHTFVSGNGLISQQEMYLMGKCKHNIIANSSFSWWGAWLNQNPDKIVIAPKKWINKVPNPHPNIVPETWIRM